MKVLIVSGTGTDVGKTVASAMLARTLDAYYWKPIQAGSPADSARVVELGVPASMILPEAYLLASPLSPHRAATIDGVTIDVAALSPPRVPKGRFLIVEGAGGLLVPLTETRLQIDLFARWGAPVILVARTEIGTINHTLLSLEALARRAIPLLGILFSGPAAPESMHIIGKISGARILGHLPPLDPLDAHMLDEAFAASFSKAEFECPDA